MEAAAAEEQRLWDLIATNPSDFSVWQVLIQLVDKSANLEKIKKAYDGFLTEYPLCYVYWKKYADHMNTLTGGVIENVISIYERSVSSFGGVPHSVDMWIHYCTFVSERVAHQLLAEQQQFQQTHLKSPELCSLIDSARLVFEKAIGIVGIDFGSHQIWEKYIDFELLNEAFDRVNELFMKVLSIPLDQINSFWDKFRLHACSRPLKELLLPEELKELETFKQQQQNNNKSDEEIEKEFRTKLMDTREKTFKNTVGESNLRKGFEQIVLKRPYFHVKPMADVYLTNWRKYLEWEESIGNHDRTVKLYERCIISACLYPEFWLMYTNYLEKTNHIDEAREIFKRGTSIFLKNRPEFHLPFAFFEEVHDQIENSRQVYLNLLEKVPGNIECFIRFAAFERRQGNVEKACEIYEKAISIITDPKQNAFIMLHYARFLERSATLTSAREIFRQTIERHPSMRIVWTAAIAFETDQIHGCRDPEAEQHVHDLYARAVSENSGLTEQEKKELWDCWSEFAADWGSSLTTFRQIDSNIVLVKKGQKPQNISVAVANVSSIPPLDHDPLLAPPSKMMKFQQPQIQQQIPQQIILQQQPFQQIPQPFIAYQYAQPPF